MTYNRPSSSVGSTDAKPMLRGSAGYGQKPLPSVPRKCPKARKGLWKRRPTQPLEGLAWPPGESLWSHGPPEISLSLDLSTGNHGINPHRYHCIRHFPSLIVCLPTSLYNMPLNCVVSFSFNSNKFLLSRSYNFNFNVLIQCLLEAMEYFVLNRIMDSITPSSCLHLTGFQQGVNFRLRTGSSLHLLCFTTKFNMKGHDALLPTDKRCWWESLIYP